MSTSKRFAVKNGLNNGNNTIENVLDPINPQDAATKNFASNANNVNFTQNGGGAVTRSVTDKLRETVSVKDFGAKGDGVTDDTAAIQAAINAAAGKCLFIDVGMVCKVDNSNNDGLNVSFDGTTITGGGSFIFTNILRNGIKISAKNVTIDNIEVIGPGNYNTTAPGGIQAPALIFIDGANIGEPINCILRNIKVISPGVMGVAVYKAVGVTIVDSIFYNNHPVTTWTNTSNNHLIRVFACARVKIIRNTLKGFCEGIVVSADTESTYTFDDYDGVIGNKSRKIIISENQITGQYDHAIYFAAECEHYIVSGNFLWGASSTEGGEGSCSLKLEGGHFTAVGNYVRDGIQMRNPYNGVISGNKITIYSPKNTATNPTKYGILSQDIIFERDVNELNINGNAIYVVGDIETDAGIRIQGPVYDGGYQAGLSNINITGNTIVGFGKTSTPSNYGFGIYVQQDMPLQLGVVSGKVGRNINISENIIDLPSYTGGIGQYGIAVKNVEYCNITNNTVNNFSFMGINIVGARYSNFENNILIGNMSSTFQRFATYEAGSDTSIHINSINNMYGYNNSRYVSYKYYLADNSSICRDQIQLLTSSQNSNITIGANDHIKTFVWSPTATGLSLTFDTSRNWSIGQSIDVINKGTQSFTVTNTSTNIGPGNKMTFTSYNGLSFYNY